MTSMDQIHRIRDLYYGQDKSLTEIASMENLDWRTVRKYVDMEDFNETPPSPEEGQHSSKLDPFKPIIDKWLMEDKKAPRKQRHTAQKVHNRLKEEAEGYDSSYRLVAAYVALIVKIDVSKKLILCWLHTSSGLADSTLR